MSKSKPTVFLSHAGQDSKFALKLQEALLKFGVQAFVDHVELKAGDNIVQWINDAAGTADYMIVLLSQNSLGRHWVETEWSSALMREADLGRTFLLPAILPGFELEDIPFLLRPKKYIDFRSGIEGGLKTLIAALGVTVEAER